MSAAATLIKRLNPNAGVGEENGYVVGIEDHTDPDGRMYRLEYRSTPDGRHALACCLFNPWGGEGRPNAGVEYSRGHVASNGLLCLGNGATTDVAGSPFTLDYVIRRARYWCTAFSVLKETGQFPNL